MPLFVFDLAAVDTLLLMLFILMMCTCLLIS